MTELISGRNLGKEMAKKLSNVGITSLEELTALGAKEVYRRLKEVYPQVCLVHLYVLEGAIQNMEFHNLSQEKKRELKVFSDSLKTQ